MPVVRHSLIGNNADTGLAGAPVGSPDADGNLIGDPAGGGVIDPLLGPLQDNGGLTFTHALLPGSSAIDAGSNPLGLLTDQRGEGFDRVDGPAADMGAFEGQMEPPIVTGVFVRGQQWDDQFASLHKPLGAPVGV